ncbi:PspC domain-containing protein [Lysinibacter cavernae]|uniref:Phage shock protein PspC (Stress-responsive transcriptional regulator) n=1 Tax=Lysinibacter cavernae TaxID=1640652 RepID=A0A7X5QYD0_9MICO|nr:PspC domain-containing protein [Lysinibacter cavernae]NIH52174.1 phage shock protein PspC (stress-responsive transcriptional regulator) [Lysinibacter cavernae]
MNTQDSNYGQQSPYTKPTPGAGFFNWVRSLNIVRSDDSWFGGVCAGVARKMQVETKWVRLFTAIGALFFGSAIVAYVVAWLVLPDERGNIHFENLLRG